MFDVVLLAVSLFFIIATVLPFIRSDEWWIRMFDFPRAQIAIGGLCTAGLYLWVGDPKSEAGQLVLVLLGLCILYQGYSMYPYTFLAAKQVLASTQKNPVSRFSLLIANVFQDNKNVRRYLEIVHAMDPDLVFAV
jgi:uncharacterized membrane protein